MQTATSFWNARHRLSTTCLPAGYVRWRLAVFLCEHLCCKYSRCLMGSAQGWAPVPALCSMSRRQFTCLLKISIPETGKTGRCTLQHGGLVGPRARGSSGQHFIVYIFLHSVWHLCLANLFRHLFWQSNKYFQIYSIGMLSGICVYLA